MTVRPPMADFEEVNQTLPRKKPDRRLHPICRPAITAVELTFQLEELIQASLANSLYAGHRPVNWAAVLELVKVKILTGAPNERPAARETPD